MLYYIREKIFSKYFVKGVDVVLLWCYTLDIPKKGAETWIKEQHIYT